MHVYKYIYIYIYIYICIYISIYLHIYISDILVQKIFLVLVLVFYCLRVLVLVQL